MSEGMTPDLVRDEAWALLADEEAAELFKALTRRSRQISSEFDFPKDDRQGDVSHA